MLAKKTAAGSGDLFSLFTGLSEQDRPYSFDVAAAVVDGKELLGWNASQIIPPLMGEEKFHVSGHPLNFKRFKVNFPATSDTYLLVRGWKKGHVWVNGHPLGRYWGIGPTQTM